MEGTKWLELQKILKDKRVESIHYGQYRDMHSFIKDDAVDLTHLKRIRKCEDHLEVLVGTSECFTVAKEGEEL